MTNDQLKTKCPRCGAGTLRRWRELGEEERMVARRMPESAAYPQAEREATHRWCPHCWHEETKGPPLNA